MKTLKTIKEFFLAGGDDVNSSEDYYMELRCQEDILRKTFTCFCGERFDPWEDISWDSPAYGNPDMAHSMEMCSYCRWKMEESHT